MDAGDEDSSRFIAWGQEMRVVHRRLLDALDIARESIENGSLPVSLATDLQLFCFGFCTALNGHHTSEDGALFPVVLADRPDLAPAVAILVRDHNLINHLVTELEGALCAGADTGPLLRHLDGIEAVMTTHFRFEEKQLVALLDGMTIDADKADLFGAIA